MKTSMQCRSTSILLKFISQLAGTAIIFLAEGNSFLASEIAFVALLTYGKTWSKHSH